MILLIILLFILLAYAIIFINKKIKRVCSIELDIFSLLKQIQMDQQALAAELTALKEQQAKANEEVKTKIAALEEALAKGGPVTQEVQDALAALKATVQASDDIIPDAVPPAEPVDGQ